MLFNLLLDNILSWDGYVALGVRRKEKATFIPMRGHRPALEPGSPRALKVERIRHRL